ncbi:ABC transporter ATP-binding protein [Paenibacillus sambharensis]|uniref:ABC transporter ATP-binding protein n=1 Tax=Paenibacillus sambharensis TaxID=1803190 RepID=A0A2W1LT73_9BACL|nr:ABC transporter ATP-binding protein [Paenibacillus sambharensis]PZD97714.1 ABC transporter ATP-binding protein [Paenibacillus sambharensis]
MKSIWIYVKRLHHFAGAKLYLNMISMTLISLFEGIGILLLVPLLSVSGLFAVGQVNIPLLDQATAPLRSLPDHLILPVILGLYMLLIIVQSYLQKQQTVLNIEIQQSFARHLRLQVYRDLLQSNWSFFLRKRKSDFNHIFTSELTRASQGTHLFLRLVTSLIFTAIQVALAFWLSFQLTLFVLVSGLLLALYARRFIRHAKSLGTRTTELSQSYMSALNDHFNGIKDIKSNLLERQHMGWFRALCDRMEHNMVQFAKLQTSSQFFYKSASAVLIALFIYFSFEVLKVPVEQLLLIIVIFSRLWPRFSSIQSSWEQIMQSTPGFDSLLELEAECAAAREQVIREGLALQKPLRIQHSMECRQVHYRYNEAYETYALRDINLRIPANSMTAVVGKSGAGKSTLIDLLIGLIRPEQGEITVDGVPLTGDRVFALRASVSYVSQEPFLFNSSIRDNLQLVDPDATDAKIWEALEFASAASFVRDLPQGLETVIGDRGVRLSGGERQRIVLARAILRKPSILVLDEATSALDTENEAKIKESLDRLKGSLTIIVIAHRLSTIRNADQVIVLEEGRIIQQGGFQQLSGESGTFGKLLRFQSEMNG